jgi:hypothetical protein
MEEHVSPARIALKFGLLTSLGIIILTTIINLAGLSLNKAVSYLVYVVLIVGLVMALKDLRNENKGALTFGQGLGLGLLVSAIVGLVVSMFVMFYNQFIDTTLIQQQMDAARIEMEGRGMEDAQIESGLAMMQKIMTPGVLFVFSVFGYLLVGLILSLIISAILKKDKPAFL